MTTTAGTTPPGTHSEREAAEWVRRMFAGIAPKYDFLNHLLSFNIDRGWRKALARRLRAVLERPEARVLDLCCGTGDVMLHLKGVAQAQILGADFCHPMLVSARAKIDARCFDAPLIEGDALELPFAAETLDAISIAFGFRNLANYEAALREFQRVLKPRGVLVILEFSHPPGRAVKTAYGFYSRIILPAIGTLISGSPEAYSYLPDSIRKFPKAEQLRQMMESADFENTAFELLTGGIAALHSGTRRA